MSCSVLQTGCQRCRAEQNGALGPLGRQAWWTVFSGGEAQRPGPCSQPGNSTAGQELCACTFFSVPGLQNVPGLLSCSPSEARERSCLWGSWRQSRQRSEAEQVRAPCGEPSGSPTWCPGPGLPRAPAGGPPPRSRSGPGAAPPGPPAGQGDVCCLRSCLLWSYGHVFTPWPR